MLIVQSMNLIEIFLWEFLSLSLKLNWRTTRSYNQIDFQTYICKFMNGWISRIVYVKAHDINFNINIQSNHIMWPLCDISIGFSDIFLDLVNSRKDQWSYFQNKNSVFFKENEITYFFMCFKNFSNIHTHMLCPGWKQLSQNKNRKSFIPSKIVPFRLYTDIRTVNNDVEWVFEVICRDGNPWVCNPVFFNDLHVSITLFFPWKNAFFRIGKNQKVLEHANVEKSWYLCEEKSYWISLSIIL